MKEGKYIELMDPLPRGFSHIPYYEDILNVLQNGSEPQTGGHEGIKSLRIISSAIESSKNNKVVDL